MRGYLMVLISLMFLGVVSAQTIELNYPDEVCFDEEFEVELKLVDFEDVDYDVKIDITKDGERVSRILVDDTFKSTFYYVENAISSEGDFVLKIVEDVQGKLDMVVRIRGSGSGVSEIFGGYEINLIEDSDSNMPLADSSSNNENEENEEIWAVYPTNNIETVKQVNKTPIKLDFNESKDIKSESSTNFYKNLFAFSGILGISVFLGMVYIIKQGKYKNEFR